MVYNLTGAAENGFLLQKRGAVTVIVAVLLKSIQAAVERLC